MAKKIGHIARFSLCIFGNHYGTSLSNILYASYCLLPPCMELNTCLVLKYMSSEAVNMFISDITIGSVDLITCQ